MLHAHHPGDFQGFLSSLTAPQLGAVVVKEAVQWAGIPDPADIHEVIMGNVVAAGLGLGGAEAVAMAIEIIK